VAEDVLDLDLPVAIVDEDIRPLIARDHSGEIERLLPRFGQPGGSAITLADDGPLPAARNDVLILRHLGSSIRG
jgi:hypothetical protein